MSRYFRLGSSETTYENQSFSLTTSHEQNYNFILTCSAFGACCDLWKIICIAEKKISTPLFENSREEADFLVKIILRSHYLLDHIKKILKVFLESRNYELFYNYTRMAIDDLYYRYIPISGLRNSFFGSMKIIVAAINGPTLIKKLESEKKLYILDQLSDFDDTYRFLRFSLLTKTFD